MTKRLLQIFYFIFHFTLHRPYHLIPESDFASSAKDTAILESSLPFCYNTKLYFFQVTAFIVLPMTWQLGTMSLGIIAGGFMFFYVLSRAGERFLRHEINRSPCTVESLESDSFDDDNDGDNTDIVKGKGVVVSFIEAVNVRRDEKSRGDNAPEVYSLLSSV